MNKRNNGKLKIGSRFVRTIDAPRYQAGVRFPKAVYDEQGRRVR